MFTDSARVCLLNLLWGWKLLHPFQNIATSSFFKSKIFSTLSNTKIRIFSTSLMCIMCVCGHMSFGVTPGPQPIMHPTGACFYFAEAKHACHHSHWTGPTPLSSLVVGDWIRRLRFGSLQGRKVPRSVPCPNIFAKYFTQANSTVLCQSHESLLVAGRNYFRSLKHPWQRSSSSMLQVMWTWTREIPKF
jgi:hypothetical protein